ncbi:MAG TPA: TIGR02281 family clan AA aspartic protease [Stellaceae bacterium]|nr:TIGR02281 family clan AA aspartic protease [Stellaceae bacterium]
MAWAVKQLTMWGIGAFFAYAVLMHSPLFKPQLPQTKPQAVVSGDTPIEDRTPLRPLGKAAPPTVYSLSLRARPDGYAYVKASVNGAEMVMAFDTGASSVSLTRADAIRAGVAGSLNYSLSFATANGRARGAPVMLREIRIGQLVIPDVHAVVMENMQVSLLGQTFLSRLRSYQMQDGVLTLTWQ